VNVKMKVLIQFNIIPRVTEFVPETQKIEG